LLLAWDLASAEQHTESESEAKAGSNELQEVRPMEPFEARGQIVQEGNHPEQQQEE